MAGFRKAKAEQAAIKMGIYGPTGSGKTFTALLCAEGLAKVTDKRVAFIDTEHGTDFYALSVPTRKIHPEAFDFDAIYTRSITEMLDEVKKLDVGTYGVLVIDSISHVWDAAMGAYNGKKTSKGGIPIGGWQDVKRPYKELMALLLSLPIHVFICGRQKNEFEENSEGEMKKVGVAMRAEGETQYEPHIGIRMESQRATPGAEATVKAIIEKDRTGVLSGKILPNPTFDSLIKPILPLLGSVQAKVETEEEVGQRDAEAMVNAEAAKARESQRLFTIHKAQMDEASTQGKKELDAASKRITAEIKKQMLPQHVTELREHYQRLCGGAKQTETAEVAQ